MIKTNAIIYHPQLAPRFAEFGIPVPLAQDRSVLAFEKLTQKIPDLKEVDLSKLPNLQWSDIRLVHDLDYISRLLDPQLSQREVEFCYELKSYGKIAGQKNLNEMPGDVLNQCRGSIQAVKLALAQGFGFFLGGGMHHAMSFAGRGFCLLNDVVLAARVAQQAYGAKKVLIIDVDAHKGDGSAQITQHDPSIVTVSLHMERGWPLDGSLGDGPWLIPSDYDIAFAVGEESQYLDKLDAVLSELDLASFDLAITVLGSDAWEHDALPSSAGIKLTSEQMLARDKLIDSKLASSSVARAYVMGGGYGPRAHEPYVNFLVDKFVR